MLAGCSAMLLEGALDFWFSVCAPEVGEDERYASTWGFLGLFVELKLD